MTAMITIDRLSKRFGPIQAVDNVSFSIARGEVLGLLGPNGAGKSTTMKMLTGFLPADEGRATVCGFDIASHPIEAKRRLGYMPEGAPAYSDMTPRGFLAFIADMRLGVIAALAVLAHEIPHHMGDLAVLRQGSSSRKAAIVKVSMAGAITALGGAVGYVLVDALHDWLPYFLVVASSSFVYVALADLIPQLQKRLSARETAAQILWLSVGIGMVVLVSAVAGHQH